MKKYIILFPLYNDWKSLWKLSQEINAEIKDLEGKFTFLFINDASSETIPNFKLNLPKIDSIKVINMKKNQLSGRCIATGLKYIIDNEEFDHVIVMDSDGEDRPKYILELINKASEFQNTTIVANRFRRHENIIYKFMYSMHKLTTFLFTGQLIKFGNFILLPKQHVQELINAGSLWNAFSASVAKIIKDKKSINADRGTRYFGPSKTSYLKLFHHSFTIISVFIKTVLLRIFLISIIYIILIYEQITMFNLLPLIIILIFLIINLIVSRRGSLKEIKNSFQNIKDIETLK